MDTCTVETGLLRKKPCGEKATTQCANCEQHLCAKHARPKMSAGKRIFLCPECERAWTQSEKTVGDLPSTPAAAPGAEKKPAEKPAAAPASAPKAAAPKPAAKPAAAPTQKKPEPPPQEDSGPLEFTPSKKPEDKK